MDELFLFPPNANSANDLDSNAPSSTTGLLRVAKIEKMIAKLERDVSTDEILTPERIPIKESNSDEEDDRLTPDREANMTDGNDQPAAFVFKSPGSYIKDEGVVPPGFWDEPENSENPEEIIASTSGNYVNARMKNGKIEFEDVRQDFLNDAPLRTVVSKEDKKAMDTSYEFELKRLRILQELDCMSPNSTSEHDQEQEVKPHCSSTLSSTAHHTEHTDGNSIEHNGPMKHSRSTSHHSHRHSTNTSPHRRPKKSKSDKDRKRRRSSSRKHSKRRRRSSRSRSRSPDLELVPVRPDEHPKLKPIKLEKLINSPQEPVNQVPAECQTLDMKKENTISRVQAQLDAFEKRRKNAGLFKEFIYTPTITKIPKKDSLICKGENRSPLSTNHNVIYKLTSTGARVNLTQYGLAQPSEPVVDLLNTVGLDVNRLEAKRTQLKMPPKLIKLMRQENGNHEGIDVGQSLLKSDAQTQTDNRLCRPATRDTGTQHRDPNVLDYSLMDDSQRYATHLFREMLYTTPRDSVEELQRNMRLLEAIKLASGQQH